MEHVKYYNEIRLPYDQLIKKAISYANTTEEPKTIIVTSPSNNLRIKHSRITIKPYSSGTIHLRLYFDRTLPPSQRGDLIIADGGAV